MSFEGSFSQTPLRDVLHHLAAERETGILTLQNEREILAVTIQRGEIVGADSLNQGEESLGALLAGEGLVPPYEFAAVVAAHRTGGGRVTDLLLERGSIDRSTLLGALRRHTLALLHQVLPWREGAYKFYTGEEVSFEEGFPPIAIEELLGPSSDVEDDPPRRRSGGLAPLEDLTGWGDLGSLTPSASPAHVPPAPRGGLAPGPFAPSTTGTSTASGWPESWGALIPPEPDEPRRVRVEATPTPVVERDWAAVEARPPARLGEAFRPHLPVLLALLLFATWFTLWPAGLLGALPWASRGADEFDLSRRLAGFQRLDTSAKTFFLVDRVYPEGVEQLEVEGLVDGSATEDAIAGRYRMASTEASYVLQVVEVGSGEPTARSVESVAGDLFLDDTLFVSAPLEEEKPLILLD